MRSSIILVAAAALVSTSTAFVNNGARTRMRTSPLSAIAVTPELESAINDVRACASEFGEETASLVGAVSNYLLRLPTPHPCCNTRALHPACIFDLGTERCACHQPERDKLNVPLANETQLIFPNELLDCDIEWIDSKLAGTQDGKAAGILEECILDDEDGKCERFSDALEKLDEMLGVVAKEQF